MEKEPNSFTDVIRSLAQTSPLKGFASTKQVAIINRALDKEFPERSVRLDYLRDVFQRTNISSAMDLSKAEASALISCLFIENWEIDPNIQDEFKVFKRKYRTSGNEYHV